MDAVTINNCLNGWKTVYDMLEDEESKEIYLNKLSWLISGKYKYLRKIVSTYAPGLTPADQNILDLCNSMPMGNRIILYGAGADGKRVLPLFAGDKRFWGFCSHTKKKQKHGYLGYPVISPEELFTQRNFSVVISATRCAEEIRGILNAERYPANLIFDIAGHWREDDPEQYFNLKCMKYEDEEVFVDAGCFDLGSSLKLKNYCNHVKKVYAFEPDPVSYLRCLEQKERTGFAEAEIFQAGTWSEEKTLYFQSTGDLGAKIDTSGDTSISVMPIDQAIFSEEAQRSSTQRVTFIKMDVEGAELESLKGARQTILRDKPKLAICIYHKPEDMMEIPVYIKALVPEYRLYVRHYSNIDTDTVLYAVMPEKFN